MNNWLSKMTDVSGLLQSKALLYFLVFISIVNIITYVSTDHQTYAGFMILIGFLTSFFSKNMIVILFVAISFTNIIRFGMDTKSKFKEGFDMKDLDKLTDHLTSANGTSENPPATQEDADKYLSETLDVKLNELIQSMDSKGMLEQMEKSSDVTHILDAKTKLTEALKHMDKIANVEQREKIKSLLEVQLKLVDYLSGISPLVGEFKSAINSIKT